KDPACATSKIALESQHSTTLTRIGRTLSPEPMRSQNCSSCRNDWTPTTRRNPDYEIGGWQALSNWIDGCPLAKQELPMFPGSSVVEQPAVNRLVAGSNPARGAIFPKHSSA